MNLIIGGAALCVVVALGLIGWWLMRRNRAARIAATDDALRAAETLLPGFAPLSVVIGLDGRGALVFAEGLRVAVLKARPGSPLAREISWHDVRATQDGLVVVTGHWRMGTVLIAGIDNLDVRRLAPQLTRARRRNA